MIKALLRYFLPLCILLLSGYRPLSAHTVKESTFLSFLNKSIAEETATLCSTKVEHAVIVSTSSSGTANKSQKKLFIAENEIEEDKWISLKALLDSANYIAAILYAFIAGYLFRYLTKCFLTAKHLAHFSSYRWHIILQVFRIWYKNSSRHISFARLSIPLLFFAHH